ncbi:MAG: hypothetical protein JXQ27_09670, partial [Acidobacteria bacterium]|nr:hypothetical protein [Acidobacteriota bacterium]
PLLTRSFLLAFSPRFRRDKPGGERVVVVSFPEHAAGYPIARSPKQSGAPRRTPVHAVPAADSLRLETCNIVPLSILHPCIIDP